MQVKQKCKQIIDKKKQLPEDVSSYIFVGKHSHEASLNRFLEFIEFLILGSE